MENTKEKNINQEIGDDKKSIIEHNTFEGLAERLAKTRKISLKIRSLIEERQIFAVIETKDGREIEIVSAEIYRPFIWVDNCGGIHLQYYDKYGTRNRSLNIEEISNVRKRS